jgi:hypothetical protein
MPAICFAHLVLYFTTPLIFGESTNHEANYAVLCILLLLSPPRFKQPLSGLSTITCRAIYVKCVCYVGSQ